MLKNILKFYIHSHFAIVLTSIFVAVVFSEQLRPFSGYSTLLVGIIFFISALKIDFETVLHEMRDIKLILLVVALSLFIFPVGVFYIFSWVFPALAIPLLVLVAMPNGMTTPVLTEVVGGKVSLALVLAVVTSLLAPFTVPLVIKIFAGTAVDLSVLDMFLKLSKVIFLPFILAEVMKRVARPQVKKYIPHSKPVSLLLIGLLTASLVSKQASILVSGMLSGEYIVHLILISLVFLVLHVIGYYSAFWLQPESRVAVVVGFVYMNIALGIYIVDAFFPSSPEVIALVVLAMLPWALFLQPFGFIIKKFKLL